MHFLIPATIFESATKLETRKLFYEDAYLREFDALVVSCSSGEKGGFIIELDKTAFYPEGGGQPADTGSMGGLAVKDVQEEDGGRILHMCTGKEAPAPGVVLHCLIDWDRRFDHMQQHSGEHIVSGMICSRFGCDNIGFHMGADTVTIDYNAAISMEELMAVEEAANRYIWEAHPFKARWCGPGELETIDYRSKKEITGEVRITEFPGADCCACCGVHVRQSSEVGLVKFISCQKFTRGTRMELLCGNRAYRFLSMNFAQNQAVARSMAASLDNTAAICLKQKEELAGAKLGYGALEAKYFALVAENYREKGDALIFMEGLSPDSVRRLCVLTAGICGGMCAVFSRDEAKKDYKYAVVSKDHDISAFIKDMNHALSGRGGGRGGFAQGSLKASEADIRKYFSNTGVAS